MVTAQDIRESVRDLGLSGRPLCVHPSLRSFGWGEGGASAVVEGLLSEGCTVMVPMFSYTFAVPPPPGRRLARNGRNLRLTHCGDLQCDRCNDAVMGGSIIST